MPSSRDILRFAVALLIGLTACSRANDKLSNIKPEPWSAPDEAVVLDLRPIQNSNSQQWMATYSGGGKTARLGIELGPTHSVDELVSSGKGHFLRQSGSDPTILLADLKKALDAKKLPSNVKKVDSLPFEFVVLGRNQSRSPNGGFSNSPPGDWIAMKLFLADGQGEVFFNLGPAEEKAEFSIKDSDYGDIVLGELAKVL
jgi:hypothetical protein